MCAFVVVSDSGEQRACARDPLGEFTVELVADGKDQGRERFLVGRVDLEDIKADTLGGDGVVEQPVALCLFEGRWNAGAGYGLQGGHNGGSSVRRFVGSVGRSVSYINGSNRSRCPSWQFPALFTDKLTNRSDEPTN